MSKSYYPCEQYGIEWMAPLSLPVHSVNATHEFSLYGEQQMRHPSLYSVAGGTLLSYTASPLFAKVTLNRGNAQTSSAPSRSGYWVD
jgi:hypothetical protein